MKRLEALWPQLRAKGRKAFMPFLVAGDPDFDTSLALGAALLDAGADILEIGFPFSDPPADGPVIQLAAQRALAAGMTPARAFELLAALRPMSEAPFTLLIYMNLVLQYGIDAFYARAREVGVDAILVADAPLEEAGPLLDAAARHEIAPIFIVSELTTEARLDAILRVARGYLYVVTTLGVTGARETLDPGLAATMRRLRAKTALPLLAGFGISEAAQVRAAIAAGADGVIVGSALVAHIAKYGSRETILDIMVPHALLLRAATAVRA